MESRGHVDCFCSGIRGVFVEIHVHLEKDFRFFDFVPIPVVLRHPSGEDSHSAKYIYLYTMCRFF